MQPVCLAPHSHAPHSPKIRNIASADETQALLRSSNKLRAKRSTCGTTPLPYSCTCTASSRCPTTPQQVPELAPHKSLECPIHGNGPLCRAPCLSLPRNTPTTSVQATPSVQRQLPRGLLVEPSVLSHSMCICGPNANSHVHRGSSARQPQWPQTLNAGPDVGVGGNPPRPTSAVGASPPAVGTTRVNAESEILPVGWMRCGQSFI